MRFIISQKLQMKEPEKFSPAFIYLLKLITG